MFINDALIQIRKNTLQAVEHLSTEQLNKIPLNHSNNIAWQIGHMMASQQILCYLKSGAKPRLSQDILEKYRKGTSPADWKEMVALVDLKALFLETAEVFQKDYEAGVFASYESYPTSSGIVLNSIDEAVTYSYGHENLHFGCILMLLKIVQ